MSYATQENRPNPSAMAATIALNGAIVGALALTTVTINKGLEPSVLIGKNIELQKDPPPPPVPKTAPEPEPTTVPPYAPETAQKIPSKNTVTTTSEWSEPPDYLDPPAKIAEAVIPKVAPAPPPIPIFIAAARDARYLNNFQPPYPTRLLQREVEGSVRVKVLIGANGRVRQAQIISATHPEFGKATKRQALSKWRFTPATRDGAKVEDWQTLTVRFKLDG